MTCDLLVAFLMNNIDKQTSLELEEEFTDSVYLVVFKVNK